MGAFNGSGTFVRSFNWVTDKTNGVNITASRIDTEDDGYATGLSLCVTRDGQGKMTTDFLPAVDNTINLGSGSFRWANINGVSAIDLVHTGSQNVFSAAVAGNNTQQVTNTNTGALAVAKWRAVNDSGLDIQIAVTGSGYSGSFLVGSPAGQATYLYAANSTSLSIGTASTERIRVASNGAVTVNAPSVGFALTVNGTNGLNVAGTTSLTGLLSITASSPGIAMNNTGFYNGSGSPNSAVSAQIGSIYLNTAGGANTTLWVKESGAGTNTGWVAK